MGFTPKLLLPYPELNDPANVPTDMRELAEALEALFYRNPVRQTAFFIAQTGWNLSGGNQMDTLIGNQCQFYFLAKRTGAAITPPTTGDITNQSVAALPTGWTLGSWGPISGGGSGRVCQWAWSGATIQLTAVSAGGSINTNDVFSCIGTAWFHRP